MSRRRVVALFALVAVLLSGCGRAPGRGTDDDAAVRPLALAWQSLNLPTPPGSPGRLLVRDVVACAGRWYVVGAVADAAGDTRPVAWSSPDGLLWTALRMLPQSHYGRQHVLYSVACRDDRIALLGAKSGGAHGNPRTSTWRQLPDGSLTETAAPFELFGGPRAVNVARITAGPAGWLIAGSRRDGAAVWASADAVRFELREGVAELAGDGRGRTSAHDAVAGPSAGWFVAGSLLPAGGGSLLPVAWTSGDAVTWRRWMLPATSGKGQAQRVARVGSTVLVVGSRGDGFGAWRWDGTDWREAGAFGAAAGPGVPWVDGLAVVGAQVVAVAGDGGGYGMWHSPDAGGSWRPVGMPAAVPDGGDSAVAVAGAGDRLVLVTDDGASSRVWSVRVQDVGR
ncbi:hypothetical protein [Micromonospora sagamiensis]|uniref:BNR repeat protein n=1 Tax=Micromonospora sagamiensis TaxID=47875 RepID=A0A562WDJ5_9ACTN|nr:hypothetical protein [Micromonospora sagamiensis]TWJ28238.1 hypothetical protein JD81_01742 [Micromonospora sagamiensis]BCL12870.1 hypothetical protein GCM10017556_06090 [Micromonospora sagamiensis]